MGHFGTSTERIQRFRQQLLDIVPAVCTERAVLTTRAYKEHEMDQIVLKRAYMLKEILENMSIYIEPRTLIVGNQATANRSAPVFPEYAMDWVIRELDDFENRPGDRFSITEEKKQVLRDIYPFWKDQALAEVDLCPEDELCIPDCIKVIKEVTGDDNYSNYVLANRGW